jgi:hypothetical protein
MAALLDLSNIVGGFMLASVLLVDLPRVGAWVRRVAESLARAALVVGVLALVMAGGSLLLAVFGLIAILVGVQGLLTANG